MTSMTSHTEQKINTSGLILLNRTQFSSVFKAKEVHRHSLLNSTQFSSVREVHHCFIKRRKYSIYL